VDDTSGRTLRTVPELVALDLPGGPGFVDALRTVWDRGDVALPVDRRLPPTARDRLVTTLAPTRWWDADGERPIGRAADEAVLADGDAVVVATSGSTGTPKGVVLTHDAIRASALATSERIGVRDDDHWLACLPLSHVGGLSVVTRALVTGTRLTVLPGFDPAEVTRRAEAGVTLVSLVATALGRVDARLFRCVVLGGSRPPADRPANGLATYGLTETGSGVVYEGRPLHGVELDLTSVGEVLVRGPMLLRCYRDGSTPIHADGWLHTGDIGSIDADGRLQVRGRRGDLIVTGGENVWPDPVEALLATHPDVADVAVVGLPDPEWGHQVTAVVVPSDRARPPSLDALRDLVGEHLPRYAAPRRLVLVEAIPRTALGKIERHRVTATVSARIADAGPTDH
jgi:O-succinylbenzoic acid--CoA ligase